MSADAEYVRQTIADTIALHERMLAEPAAVLAAARMIVESIGSGGTLLVFGNGGSASDAQHVAAELVGRFERERRGLAAVALTTDTSVLTSIANDYAFDRVFERQIAAIGRAGDVALGISTSGQSENVAAALHAARARGLHTIALTGRDGGRVGAAADVHINVPGDATPRIQEVHRTLLHAICGLVENALTE
jgi:phosphoheptose isomerase